MRSKAMMALVVMLIAGCPTVFAQQAESLDTPVRTTDGAATPSPNAMVNLIRLLVAQKVITKEAGEALMRQAIAEAELAQGTSRPAPVPTPPAVAQAAPPVAPGTIRVPYVPEFIRKQIKEELKGEVIAQAKAEGWAAPNQLPEWVRRIKWNGDFRLREEADFYANSNSNSIVDYGAFNANGPTEVNPRTNNVQIPYLNTLQDRTVRLRIRARLGFTAKLSDFADVGVRLATGDDTSPISTNQILGGGLGKKNIYLDQAYLTIRPSKWSELTFGRSPNPFIHTDLVFDEDLNFDGISAQATSPKLLERDLVAQVTLGAFPLEFSSDSFPTNSQVKSRSASKWLYAAQASADWQINPRTDFKLAAAYYYFNGLRGQLSAPCSLTLGNRQCSSDFTRAFFLRKGNTVGYIRQILDDNTLANGPLFTPQPQLVGLIQDYHLLNITSNFDYKLNDRWTVSVTGDYVRNLAYSSNLSVICRNGIIGQPQNNVLPTATGDQNACPSTGSTATLARYQSGADGWLVRARFGYSRPRHFGEWRVDASYRYLAADATLDAFTDSDFHLGGTNARGYTLEGTLGLFDNISIAARWLSANEVSGAPYAIDVFHLDLKAEF